MNIWLWPIVVGIVSMTGLLVGLLFDGAGDMFAWLALGLPVALSLRFGWLKR